jgi:Tfp pilus assembly protein PilV
VDELKPTRRRGGVSLIKVMLALTILGIGMLSLGAIQLLALEYGNRGRHGT